MRPVQMVLPQAGTLVSVVLVTPRLWLKVILVGLFHLRVFKDVFKDTEGFMGRAGLGLHLWRQTFH